MIGARRKQNKKTKDLASEYDAEMEVSRKDRAVMHVAVLCPWQVSSVAVPMAFA